MIVLKDIIDADNKLQEILTLAVEAIENKSVTTNSLLKLSGIAFEKVVCDVLNAVSLNTVFHNNFVQSGAHTFPDIYNKIFENNWFGVEVKTSQKDWKCFGNSIFETTKLENLEDRIYVFFGNFSQISLKCRWAKYDECIDNINITHSPRYQINMDIKNNRSLSVFSQMDTTYLNFSSREGHEKMDFLRKFKRKGLGQDVALWWLPDHEGHTKEDEEKLIIKLFSSLKPQKKNEIRNAAIAFFPEIFSKKNSKYFRIPTWLASEYGVVMGNIRDLFSSGGGWDVAFNGEQYKIPRICSYIYEGRKTIKALIINTPQEELLLKWKISNALEFTTGDEKLNYWIEKVGDYLKEQKTMPSVFPVNLWLKSLFKP